MILRTAAVALLAGFGAWVGYRAHGPAGAAALAGVFGALTAAVVTPPPSDDGMGGAA